MLRSSPTLAIECIDEAQFLDKSNGLSYQTQLMNRTRNKNTDNNIQFQILIGEYRLVITVPKETRVAELVNMVRSYDKLHEQYGPKNYHFLGLASINQNQIIDYLLTQAHLNFTRFKNKLTLKTLYSCPMDGKVEKISVNQFHFLKCLGEGACGSVFLVRSKITGNLFALKRLKKESLTSEDAFRSIFRQQKILRMLPSSNHTVKFHASFQSANHFNYLIDFYPGGQLFVHLSQQKLSVHEAKVYFCEILTAIQFLHRNNILYRDLKPQNILVGIDGHLCIADFGLSKCNFKEDDNTNSHCGSPDYMAPEVIESKDYNYCSDFYSIGAILYEFISGLPPYYDHDPVQEDQLEQKLQKMKKMQLNLDSFTNNRHLRQLIKGLLHPNPDSRICTFKQIKNSPWLADIDWKKIQDRSLTVPFLPNLYKTYINQEFLEKKDLVSQMNQFESEKFQSFQFFDCIMPQSEKLIFGRSRNLSKGAKKKKSFGYMKEKGVKQLNTSSTNKSTHKGNVSITVLDKEHQCRQNRGDTSTTSNTNPSLIQHKGNKENKGLKSGRNFQKKVASKKTSALCTPVIASRNCSAEKSHRKAEVSKQKNMDLKSKKMELSSSKGILTPSNKSKSKQKGNKIVGGLRKEMNSSSSRPQKKEILPLSSFKIKLM